MKRCGQDIPTLNKGTSSVHLKSTAKTKLSASLICADPLNIKADLFELKAASVDMIHFDVMDGQFVPRYGLYPEILSAIRAETSVEVDVHMMVDNPHDYIELFANAGASFFNFHIEAVRHPHNLIRRIVESGMKPGIAINPGTPIGMLEPLIEEANMVVMMAINPGIVGHKLISAIYDRIREVRRLAENKNNSNLLIEIDGGVTFESAPKMVAQGADVLVCGTGTIFRKAENSITKKIEQLRAVLGTGS
jgi:ribulose-phosphate 3-epimerase